MTVDEIQSKLCSAVEQGVIDVNVLDSQSDSVISARSAEADIRAALSSYSQSSSSDVSQSVLDKLTQALAGSLHRVSPTSQKDVLRAVYSYDGGLEMSFFGKWGLLSSGDSCCEVLKRQKVICAETGKSTPVSLGGYPFWLLPKGVRSGFGSYSYVLLVEEEGRVKYRFMIHTSPSAQIAGVRVKAEYQAFRYGRDLSSVHSEILSLISCLGFDVDYERLSRVDFNITINHSIKHLNDAYLEDRICNKCSEVSLKGAKRSFSSYRIGDINNIQFAVYDKFKELSEKYDIDKINDLEKVFGYSSDLTRYEYRLGRRFLHSIGIDTVEDFLNNRLSLVNYLTFDWYLVKQNKSRSGKKINYKIAQFWEQVRWCFLVACASDKNVIIIEPSKDSKTGADIKHYQTLFHDDTSLFRRPLHLKRKFRGKLRNLFKISIGCISTAILLSSSSGMPLEKCDFQKSVVRCASLLAEKAYDKYRDKSDLIEGLERDFQNAYLPTFMGELS